MIVIPRGKQVTEARVRRSSRSSAQFAGDRLATIMFLLELDDVFDTAYRILAEYLFKSLAQTHRRFPLLYI